MKLAALILIQPFDLYACAVCFGKSDNPNLGGAFNYGLFILMGFTFAILAALGIAIYRIESGRNRAHTREELGPFYGNGDSKEKAPDARSIGTD